MAHFCKQRAVFPKGTGSIDIGCWLKKRKESRGLLGTVGEGSGLGDIIRQTEQEPTRKQGAGLSLLEKQFSRHPGRGCKLGTLSGGSASIKPTGY